MEYVLTLTKIFLILSISFIIGMVITPFLSFILYKYRIIQGLRKAAADGRGVPVFTSLHKNKKNTPTAGGVLIWFTVLFLAFLIHLLKLLTGFWLFNYLDFLSRPQTWLPLFTLVSAGILGLVDDLINVFGKGMQKGIRITQKFIWQAIIALGGAWWFYYKLDWTVIHIPGGNYFGLPYNVDIGFLYVPLFILVIIACANAVNITDGLDGLAGGVAGTTFGAFTVIAFVQGKIELAAFCGAILGVLLAFLWFNIYPARFFMGDTGSLALGATLGVVALLTNSVIVLPIIGFVFVIETLSSMIQLLSKKFRGGKQVFKCAPLHHHFEAIGWPEPKVTMRFWVVSAIFAGIGLIIGLIGMG